jgi:hypothetical protein
MPIAIVTLGLDGHFHGFDRIMAKLFSLSRIKLFGFVKHIFTPSQYSKPRNPPVMLFRAAFRVACA